MRWKAGKRMYDKNLWIHLFCSRQRSEPNPPASWGTLGLSLLCSLCELGVSIPAPDGQPHDGAVGSQPRQHEWLCGQSAKAAARVLLHGHRWLEGIRITLSN